MLDIYKANPVITEDDVLNLLNFVDADADEEAVAVVNEIKAAYGECTLDNIQNTSNLWPTTKKATQENLKSPSRSTPAPKKTIRSLPQNGIVR